MVYPVVDVRCILPSMPKDKTTPIDAQKANGKALALQEDVPQSKVIDHALIARLMIREGKPWKESALAGGYAESVATRGIRAVMASSQSLSDAIRAEEKRIDVSMDRLKPLAINRLYHEILSPTSNNGMKAIELAGRFKETDWFVRQSETNLGILINMHESVPAPEPQTIDVVPE